jgi:hypothetical protein
MPIESSHYSTLLVDSILRTAAYEDVFDYALTLDEIHRLLFAYRTQRATVHDALQKFAPLSFQDGYYTLPGREALAGLRRQRAQAAAHLWPEAVRYGRWMARMPFVRMLAVTGSLAMNNPAADADIDFLVVTAAGRLWTCRALLLMVVRLAAQGGVRLCPNYLVSEGSLVFQERTLYTAHELVQMIPVYGLGVYTAIRDLNRWTERFLPNAGSVLAQAPALPDLDATVRRPGTLEAGLLRRPGTWFERWEKERKIRKLSRQQGDSPEACFSADLCKGHKDRHAEKTEQIFRQRLQELALEREP